MRNLSFQRTQKVSVEVSKVKYMSLDTSYKSKTKDKRLKLSRWQLYFVVGLQLMSCIYVFMCCPLLDTIRSIMIGSLLRSRRINSNTRSFFVYQCKILIVPSFYQEAYISLRSSKDDTVSILTLCLCIYESNSLLFTSTIDKSSTFFNFQTE